MASSVGGNKAIVTWILALLVTFVAITYQRLVGPTRPVRGHARVGAAEFRYRLPRSHGGSSDCPLSIGPLTGGASGILAYRRYKTEDPWTLQPLRREGDRLAGSLPHQPPAGKVVYRFYLRPGGGASLDATTTAGQVDEARLGDAIPQGSIGLPPSGPVVLRFRGGVPVAVMAPHVFLMFLGMLLSNRAGIAALRREGALWGPTLQALGVLVLGGLLLGPIVQWYAFGKAWTGFPFGYDLTDNKTLIAVLAWAGALAVGLRARRGVARRSQGAGGSTDGTVRAWVLVAALVTLVIFSIPHSVIGSELDYSKLPTPTAPHQGQ